MGRPIPKYRFTARARVLNIWKPSGRRSRLLDTSNGATVIDHFQAQYDVLVQDLCRAAGIEGWSAIAASQHMIVGDQLIGLIPNFEGQEPTLSIYIELGQTSPERDAALYARMLESNLQAPEGTQGRYGLHPESKQAVYCMSFGLFATSGAEIARLLEAQLALVPRIMEQPLNSDRQVIARLVEIDQFIEA